MNSQNSVLLTDLYQLTMLQAYFREGMEETAVFEFFIRDLPEGRGFFVTAGLEQALQYLEGLRFTEDELQWVRDYPLFDHDFVDYLAQLRFTGDVHAMREGTVCFPNEPLLRITAPLPQAQLVESRLINILHFQTLIASKAARCVLAAPDKLLVDFGFRRAHGAEAGLMAARAAYLAGFSGTATVLANRLLGIPVFGTMAHSFIEAHDVETDAFEQFARAQPENVTLLIDTYDTETAARKLTRIAPRLAQQGIHIRAVRLDSGDLGQHARAVREILDRGGLRGVHIFSSGNLDEHKVKQLLDSKAPIDGFGIGTHLDTSSDAPYLDCAYKLMEYDDIPRRKKSEGKASWPGRKQVYRHYGGDSRMERDLVALETEAQGGEQLLWKIMSEGRRLAPAEPLSEARLHARNQLALLPDGLRRLHPTLAYEVEVSQAIRDLAQQIDERQAAVSAND